MDNILSQVRIFDGRFSVSIICIEVWTSSWIFFYIEYITLLFGSFSLIFNCVIIDSYGKKHSAVRFKSDNRREKIRKSIGKKGVVISIKQRFISYELLPLTPYL